MSILKKSIVLTLCIGSCACVVQPPSMPDDPYYAPVMQAEPAWQKPTNGSLYSQNTSLALFSDNKARNVGDLITVILQERTSSSKSSNIEMIKENSVDIPVVSGGTGTLLGATQGALNTSLNAEREFKGEAETDQSNRLTGSISVSVVDVFPNGTLVIRGEKWITLNRGDEFIRISGLVRADDVSPTNTVLSTKIANARIAYSGTGEFADSQQQGWLTRFFNSPVWPF